MKIKTLNFNNSEHFLFLNYLINLNKSEFLDDCTDGQDLINSLAEGHSPIFIIYKDKAPYGLIYAVIDKYKIATLHASVGSSKNFFLNKKIMLSFIKYLFEAQDVNKIRIELLVYSKSSEFVARCCGFRKEGILREEIYINGKAQNMLLLALTKSDYKKNKHIVSRKWINNELARMGCQLASDVSGLPRRYPPRNDNMVFGLGNQAADCSQRAYGDAKAAAVDPFNASNQAEVPQAPQSDEKGKDVS